MIITQIFYGNVKAQTYDFYFINFIKRTKKLGSNLVDIGGGASTFAKLLKAKCPDVDVTVIDPSEKLLSKINDMRIKKLQGKLPNQMILSSRFDYIHVKEVFHHIVGSSINESKNLLRESLCVIHDFRVFRSYVQLKLDQ